MPRLMLAMLAAMLAGCAGDPMVTQLEQVLAQDRAFANGDLQNAIAKAKGANDLVGQGLWLCLLPVTVTPYPDSVGVATALEDARIAKSCLPAPAPILPR